MKFVKGVLLGTAITAGVLMMYSDEGTKWVKKGKKLARKLWN